VRKASLNSRNITSSWARSARPACTTCAPARRSSTSTIEPQNPLEGRVQLLRERMVLDLGLEQPRPARRDRVRAQEQGPRRLAHIVPGYHVATWFNEVRFLTSERDGARRLARALAAAAPAAPSDRLSVAGRPSTGWHVGPGG
jgi:hypothetical protein